ncbi:hypothetical protein HanPI659440_Chr02g0049361 [Helianthus annuus]|nr:hypothetical protein HanPI659440_Chr02g0049361 [Helianthus annuus]
MENKNNIPLIADRLAENPDGDTTIRFDMIVSLIFFLLRVQSNDGDEETE